MWFHPYRDCSFSIILPGYTLRGHWRICPPWWLSNFHSLPWTYRKSDIKASFHGLNNHSLLVPTGTVQLSKNLASYTFDIAQSHVPGNTSTICFGFLDFFVCTLNILLYSSRDVFIFFSVSHFIQLKEFLSHCMKGPAIYIINLVFDKRLSCIWPLSLKYFLKFIFQCLQLIGNCPINLWISGSFSMGLFLFAHLMSKTLIPLYSPLIFSRTLIWLTSLEDICPPSRIKFRHAYY